MDRRRFIVNSGATLFLPTALARSGLAEGGIASSFPTSHPATDQSYAAEMPDMLESYVARKLNHFAAIWDKKRDILQSARDVEARNAFVREKFLLMLGRFPEKSTLQATTVKVTEKAGYKVENVMFCSRPDFWVTGNLYVPTSGSGPFAGIISPCGHYPLARMTPQYQSAYISMVKRGFVVFAYDPIGQGERRQYWNPATNVTEVGGPVFEHSMPGQELLLLGQTLTEYFVWDGMRAIDYLMSRPEVDPEKIGCAGHSGGGTMTKFISVADPRVRCAVILEGGTANEWPTKSIWIGDAEQNLFPAAVFGIDSVDLHTAIAPRPLLACVEHYNKGFHNAADAIRERYRQLGAEEHFGTVAADDPHSWTPKLRRATTDWFCRWFYGRKGPSENAAYEVSRPEALYCTPDGSLRHANKGRTIYSIIAERAAAMPPPQPLLKTEPALAAYQSQVREKVRSLLRLEKPTQKKQPLGVRLVATTPREGYHIEKIEFLSEPGIYLPTWVFVPENSRGVLPTILYLNDEGMQADGMEFEGPESSGLRHGVLDEMARSGFLVIAVDVRGVGETRASGGSSLTCGEFGQLFDMDTAIAYASWSLNQSLLGMRVEDILRSVDYAVQHERADQQHLHLIGKGRAGLWCLFAAALDSRIRSLICVDSLLSYHALTDADRYLYGGDVFVPEILLHLDLPQVAAAVSPRSLTLIAPKDAMKGTVTLPMAEAAYQWTREIYELFGASNEFRIECVGPEINIADRYIQLLHATGKHCH
jgi:cephalosporin-C deacetylase-like acetyl esterase